MKVIEGSRLLDQWVVSLCEISGEYAVEHYVGGEDGYLFDDFYKSRGKALDAARVLNEEAETYNYTRDWEGDPILEYEHSK